MLAISAIPEINVSLGFNMMIHPARNAITRTSRKGNASPRKDMNHHFCGLRKGTRQLNKKTKTTMTLQYMKNRFVNNLSLEDISRISLMKDERTNFFI